MTQHYRRDLYRSLAEARGYRSPLDIMRPIKKRVPRLCYDRNGYLMHPDCPDTECPLIVAERYVSARQQTVMPK